MSAVPDRVDVYLPEHGLGTVPREDLQDALNAGGKVVPPEQAQALRTSGKVWGFVGDQRGSVPHADLTEAQQDGFRVASLDEALQAVEETRAKSDQETQALLDSYVQPSHGDTTPQRKPVLRSDAPADEALNAGEIIGAYLDTPEQQARISERKQYEQEQNLAFLQGATRYVGGDLLREGFNKIETNAQEAIEREFGIPVTSQSDIFQERAEVLKNREYNPNAATLGEFASIVVPSLLSGGTSVAARFNPAALATRAGQKAAGAVTRAAAPRIAAPVTRVLGQTAVGATEGALWSAATTVNDAFLNASYDDLGEKVVAGMSQGLAFGAGAGLATSAIGAGLDRLGKKKAPTLPDAPSTSLAPPNDPSLPDYTRIGVRDAGDRMTWLGRKVREALIDPDEAAAIKQDLHREIRERFVKLKRVSDGIDGDANIAAKRGHLTSVYTDPVEVMPFRTGTEAVQYFRHQVGLADEELLTLLANKSSAGQGGRSRLGVLQEQLQGIEDNFFAEVNEPTKGAVYAALDQTKRSLGTAAEGVKNPFVQQSLRRKYEQLRQILQDPKIWGEKLANEQIKVNAAWAEAISASRHDALRKFYMTGSESAQDLFQKLEVPNDATLNSLINGIGKAENETLETAVLKHLEATAADASMRAELWGSERLRSEAAQLGVLADQIKLGLSTAKGLNNRLASGSGGKLSQGIPLLGGGAGGAVLISGASPLTAGALAVGGYALAKGAKAIQAKKTRSMFPTIDKAIKVQEGIDRATGIVNRIEQAVDRPALRNTLREAAEDKTSGEPSELNEWLRDLFSDDDNGGPHSLLIRTRDETPELLPAVVSTMQRQRDFLAAKLEDPSITPTKAMAYASAVRDPASVFDRMAEGEAIPEHMEALQAVYPGMHREVVTRINDALESKPYQVQLITRSKLGISPVEPDKLLSLQMLAGSQAGAQQMAADEQTLSPSRRRAPRIHALGA